MKKFHGIESILTKIEKEENIEENFGELEENSEFHPRKTGKKSLKNQNHVHNIDFTEGRVV